MPTENPASTRIPANAIFHGECGQWWTGAERSHASCCHRTFSSLSAFERHRKGLRCNDPAAVGLIAREKPFGVLWGWPAPAGGYGGIHAAHATSERHGPETYIAEEPGGCATCGYDYSPGEEIGDVNGETNCDGCFDRAVDAGIV